MNVHSFLIQGVYMNRSSKSLRLLFPQWQGGNNPLYSLGTELLQWLAPDEKGITERVNVTPIGQELDIQNGTRARNELVAQQEKALSILNKQNPDTIVTFGGDCLVSLVPFSWLNEKYGDKFGILWIDSHPDVQTSQSFENAHAYVLGNLVGNGDKDFTQFVVKPVSSKNVLIAGLHNPLPVEEEILKELAIPTVSPKQLKENQAVIQEWLIANKIEYLAIHIDLDVLASREFRSILFAKPYRTADQFGGVAEGELMIRDVLDIVKEANQHSTVVGLTIAEHLPWDAQNLQKMLEELPLIGR